MESGTQSTSGGGWKSNICGGSSGGGSVNLFYRNICDIQIPSQIDVSSKSSISGGIGGSGTANINKVESKLIK